MKRDILEDLGENYEYLRIIVTNTLKLKQLELIELSASIATHLALAAVGLLFALVIMTGVGVMAALILCHYVSPIAATGIVILLYLISLTLIIIYRKAWVYPHVLRIFYKLISNHK